MVTTSGPEPLSGQSLDSEVFRPVRTGGRRVCSTFGILIFSGLLLACGARTISAYPSVGLASDRQALLLTSADRSTPSRFTVQSLPTESTLAPGLYFRPRRFELVRVSPDGRYAAFSAAGHHHLVGLLDLAAMAVREIDIVTDGDVVAFHWAADGQTLAYDYVPASGYRRVKAYDVLSGEGLVVPCIEGRSAVHITFEAWGPQPREVLLNLTDVRSNERLTDIVTLIPRK